MTDSTALGDRMKAYENCWKPRIPRRTYTIIRVDGKAFHTLLRNAQKPFDGAFMFLMGEVAEKMCREIPGTAFAYQQSDEISFLLTDFDSTGTEPWLGGVVQKIASISAAMATEFFTYGRGFIGDTSWNLLGGPSLFDSRVFVIPDPVEVGNYFIWRQRDAVTNSVQMAGQAVYSQEELHGLSGNQIQEKLFSGANINWNDYPEQARRGMIVRKIKTQVPTPDGESMVTRTHWQCSGAPIFKIEPGSFLPDNIPVPPPLPGSEEENAVPS